MFAEMIVSSQTNCCRTSKGPKPQEKTGLKVEKSTKLGYHPKTCELQTILTNRVAG